MYVSLFFICWITAERDIFNQIINKLTQMDKGNLLNRMW